MKNNNQHKLHITIQSFSYKKGVSKDLSGNGGGFVFDCRGILNPGRQEEYRKITGKDGRVMEYLEIETKMPEFLNHIWKVLDITIENYISRNFDHLKISFGCTGGQHRSVYAAEQTAKYIKEKYPVDIKLIHLEQDDNDLDRCPS